MPLTFTYTSRQLFSPDHSIYLLLKCHILPYGVECIYIIMVRLTGPIVPSLSNHLTYIAHTLFEILIRNTSTSQGGLR
jgi:hypothetical protein